jgi:hypothetical protein
VTDEWNELHYGVSHDLSRKSFDKIQYNSRSITWSQNFYKNIIWGMRLIFEILDLQINNFVY